ncbi:MAG TPA: hypothetical protein VGS28_00285 [Candidatus Saccharimonadales bacterium]|nr:hypothetical protein [Candidatus Saccharimonadales bacterium]
MRTDETFYPGFRGFRDEQLLIPSDELTDDDRQQGRQEDEEFRHYQIYPYIYPGDKDPRTHRPEDTVWDEYVDFVAQARVLGKFTSRLVVVPGRRGTKEDPEYEDILRRVYQKAHEAGEKVRIAWFENVVAHLEEHTSQSVSTARRVLSPLFLSYAVGVHSYEPHESSWTIIPRGVKRQLGRTAAVMVALMSYGRDNQLDLDETPSFRGMRVFRRELPEDIDRFIAALDDIYEDPVLSKRLYDDQPE